MADELEQLAHAAAQTLVSAMASSVWETAKHRFGRILAGREASVERSRQALGSGADGAVAAETSAWATRLRDALDQDPFLAYELRSLLEPASSAPSVTYSAAIQHSSGAGSQQAAATAPGATAINAQGQARVDSPDQRRFSLLAPVIPLGRWIVHTGAGKAVAGVAVLAVATGGLYAALHGSAAPSAPAPSVSTSATASGETGAAPVDWSNEGIFDYTPGQQMDMKVAVGRALTREQLQSTVGCNFVWAGQDNVVYPVTVTVSNLSAQPMHQIQLQLLALPYDHPEADVALADLGDGETGCVAFSQEFSLDAHASMTLRGYMSYLSDSVPKSYGVAVSTQTIASDYSGEVDVMVLGDLTDHSSCPLAPPYYKNAFACSHK